MSDNETAFTAEFTTALVAAAVIMALEFSDRDDFFANLKSFERLLLVWLACGCFSPTMLSMLVRRSKTESRGRICGIMIDLTHSLLQPMSHQYPRRQSRRCYPEDGSIYSSPGQKG